MGICSSKTRLNGKLAVVTGGNTGIGLETAKGLAARGARVIIGCRNKTKGLEAVKMIIDSTGNREVSMMQIDMADFKSVHGFVEEFNGKEERLDILVNNAGMGSNRDAQGKRTLTLTGDKIELLLQTNHYGPFLLTNLLKKALAAAGNARVVNVASVMNIYGSIDFGDILGENSYDMSYSNSKLMNILFSNELARRWKDLGISSFSLHPGFVRTEIFDKKKENKVTPLALAMWLCGKSSFQGAQTSLHCCTQPGIEGLSGTYWSDCRTDGLKRDRRMFSFGHSTNPQAWDADIAAKLWEESKKIVDC